ncbi:MAG TPA: TatD family hydrolase [Anaerolineales bacterium]
MLTDTHCHLDSQAFEADRGAVIRRALDAGVTRMLTPGLNLASSQACADLAVEYPSIFAAVGWHPTEPATPDASTIAQLRELAARPRVVAIGEIGLDYYWVRDPGEQSDQRDLLRAQLHLATDVRKPVILHCREQGDAAGGPCAEDLLSILGDWLSESGEAPMNPGVLHSFAGSLSDARRAIDLGFYIGITGPVTYKNAENRRQTVAALPLERLLIETDSPYLAPHPHRGKRNEPAYVAHIADKIAAILSISPQEVVAVTAQNAARLFSWGETA